MNEASRPVAAIAVATLLLAACGSTDRVAAPAEFAIEPGAVTGVSIAQGTQARIGDLSIGLGSVRTDDYVDERGAPRRGPVAVLQMVLQGDAPKTERVAVHAGQVLELSGYAIFVEEVRGGGPLEGLGPPGTPSGGISLRVRRPTASVGTDACAGAAGSRDWMVESSYSRRVVPRGDSVEVGVAGREGATLGVTVRAPDGSELRASKVREGRMGSTTHYVARYPADFAASGARGLDMPGTYTVRWEANGALVACDRFEVSVRGVADAQPCAPAGWSTSPSGRSLGFESGTATMSIAGAERILGLVEDPWYAFQAADRQSLALGDGSTGTMYVSLSSSPKRVSAEFTAGLVGYRFEASAEGVADLVERSRDVVVCAHGRLSR